MQKKGYKDKLLSYLIIELYNRLNVIHQKSKENR